MRDVGNANVCAVILAAGDGTRMKSGTPKVLCEVLFKPMILWVAELLKESGIENCAAILGAGKEETEAILPGNYKTILQAERKGTGHAVMMAADYIKSGGFSDIAVLCGDAPFIRPDDLLRAFSVHKENKNAVTVLSAELDNPKGYGRIIKNKEGRIASITEEKDISDENTRAVKEINTGAYWFDSGFLLSALNKLTNVNAGGEYYLTDTVETAVKNGLKAGAVLCHPDAALGANDRKGLAVLNETARVRVLDRLMEDGADIPFPAQVTIGPGVKIGPDTRILPGCILTGDTVIGKGCEIGPGSRLHDAVIGDGSAVIASFIESSRVGMGAKIGPMSNIRPDCVIADGAKIGDFVELKNSTVGKNTSVAHLTYVGDTDVGERCNFGCGVVTVNYDGAEKYRTTIGDGAFIGCNTNLIAPVTLGDRVYCAAGTTVTEDVPADALVIGRAKQIVKENWNKNGDRYKKGTVKK